MFRGLSGAKWNEINEMRLKWRESNFGFCDLLEHHGWAVIKRIGVTARLDLESLRQQFWVALRREFVHRKRARVVVILVLGLNFRGCDGVVSVCYRHVALQDVEGVSAGRHGLAFRSCVS